MKKSIFLFIASVIFMSGMGTNVSAMKALEPSKEITSAPKFKKVTYNYKTKKVYVTIKNENWTKFRAKLKGSKKFHYKNGSQGKKYSTFVFKIKASKVIIVQKKPDTHLYWSKKLIVKRSQYVTKKPKMLREWRSDTDNNDYMYAYGKGKTLKNALVKIYYKGKVVKKIKTKTGNFRYKIKVKYQEGKHLKVSAKVKNKKRSWPIACRDFNKQHVPVSY